MHVLNGNHETINSDGRFRYASAEGMQEFQEWRKLFAAMLKEKMGGKLRSAINAALVVNRAGL